MKTWMFYAACHFRFKKQHFIIIRCASVSQGTRQLRPLKGWAPCWATQTHLVVQWLPPAVSRSWQDAGLSAWSASTMWLDIRVGGRSRAGHSRPVYLLFSSPLTARDQLALLNWALSAHIAALKLPDGWEGINSSCCLQELLQSNGTITQVGLACVRG